MSTYGQNLALVTNEALRNGVAPQEIILHLELIVHELKSSVLAQAAQAQSQADAPAIILPRNGRPS